MVTLKGSAIEGSLAWPADRPIPPLDQPLPAGTTVVSSDGHWLEPERWVDKIPARFRDRAPMGMFLDGGGFTFSVDGQKIDNPAFPSRMIEGVRGMWDADQRIKDYDAEGLDKELLFPQKAFGVIRVDDKEFVAACFAAYNELLADFCRPYPDRLYGVALVNYWDADAAKDSLAQIEELGMKAMAIPSLPRGVYYNSRAMEPFWDVLEESGIPLSFHVGEFADARGLGGLATTIMQAFGGFRRLWSLLTFSGILERHPKLRVVFTEGGISWVPSALFDADRTYLSFESEMRPKLAHPPSYYWYQNCYATFMEDPPGIEQLHRIGWDRVMWSGDYGHPESTIGYTAAAVRELFAQVGDDEKAKAIVGGTAIDLWHLR